MVCRRCKRPRSIACVGGWSFGQDKVTKYWFVEQDDDYCVAVDFGL